MKSLMIITLMSLMQWQNNLISTLLKMEILMLMATLTLMMTSTNHHYTYLIMMLTMMVTSSTLGISMTITLARTNKSVTTNTTW